MDREYTKELEEKCIQDCPPKCRNKCPLNIDLRAMLKAVQKDDFTQALSIYMKSVIFPEIISRICDGPCLEACIRADLGGAVEIRKIEEAVVRYGSKKERKIRILRKRNERVAVIGGGLTGLSSAFHLYEKGYKVHVFEKRNCLGGRVLKFKENGLSEDIINTDLKLLKNELIEISLNTAISDDDFQRLSDSFSAILVTTGIDSEYGWTDKLPIDSNFFTTSTPGIFAAGSLLRKNYSPALSLSDGRSAAISIDRYLQGVSIGAGREAENADNDCLFTNTSEVKAAAPIVPDGDFYSKEEAVKEASRCLLCECMECVKACSLLEYYESYPRKYVRELSNSINQFYGVRKTKHMINGCTYCGLCGKLCPNDLSMGEVCKNGKRELVERGIMPPAIHDFPIQDMLDAVSDSCSLTLGKEQPDYIYFPGCQMQAIMPDLLLKSYLKLRELIGADTALHLGCCGAPAEWAGRTEMRDDVLALFSVCWESLGKPKIIYACTSCRQILTKIAEDEKLVSVWEIFDERLPEGIASGDESSNMPAKTIAISDSCTAKELPKVRKSVRSLFKKQGYEPSELKYNGEEARCCGFGGLVSHAEPDIGSKISLARISESPLEYGVYCVMCGEHFRKEGKNTSHILEILFGQSINRIETGKRTSWSLRQDNRRRLFEKIQNEFLPEAEKPAVEEWENLKLYIEPEIFEEMEERMILIRNVQRLIYESEISGQKILDPGTGRYTASNKPGVVTYWAEYSPEKDGYRLHKAYSHRLEIKDQ